ncbi:enoyl-CoA hydratase/isomerase family protein [Ramlibacter tataouinensis]|uniref:enoyl-CoA hydratase/isomerase family protein n=1 Tax=Ramlibacter tataouinensis TaxID=94132 RepID=UPI0022F3BC4B|nr:enoyl-CoA hydratase/isomerase family protein [Ramlibacter tataouinensis]WBY02049.1 enoyl-CoA hydratase/isomerase family protein [Ramlibacter tataouinensis]
METTGMSEVRTEVAGKAGRITLDRPRALNALSLAMIRELKATLRAWRDDPRVEVVAIRGMGKEGPFGAFCAGGDIRFFHAAALAGNPELEDFFTEEYTLNHLVQHYPKPYVSFMDGIVMGGGMGISQGARCRIVTERTKMAMPETGIGLFPDVGGGHFLSRCPGRIGEYLALTGEVIGAADAVDAGLADLAMPSSELPALWERLAGEGAAAVPAPQRAEGSKLADRRPDIDRVFALGSVREIVAALEADGSDWARHTAGVLLRKRSPLMLHVTLEQVRRARGMSLADELRMERDLVRHCFHLRPGASETVEGVRALAIDKDHAPRWSPARIEDVTAEMVEPFFRSPWPVHAHPLRGLA